jgi:hypothetical protein
MKIFIFILLFFSSLCLGGDDLETVETNLITLRSKLIDLKLELEELKIQLETLGHRLRNIDVPDEPAVAENYVPPNYSIIADTPGFSLRLEKSAVLKDEHKQKTPVFQKLQNWGKKAEDYSDFLATEDLTRLEISQSFPNLAFCANNLATLFKGFKNLLSNDSLKAVVDEWGSTQDKRWSNHPDHNLSWCTCAQVTVANRFFLMLCQLNDIVAAFPVAQHNIAGTKLVHTAFLEGGCLHTYFFAKAILACGYNIHLNIIGLYINTYFKIDDPEQLEVEFKKSFTAPEQAKITAKFYLDNGAGYIKDVADNGALRSHSLDSVDAGNEVTTDEESGKSLIVILRGRYDDGSGEWIKGDPSRVFPLFHFYVPSDPLKFKVLAYGRKMFLPPLEGSGFRDHKKDVRQLIERFVDQFKKQKFQNYDDVLRWLQNQPPSLKKIIKAERIAMSRKNSPGDCKAYFDFGCSAPMDFCEIVEKTKISNQAIIYEAQMGRVIKHSGSYVSTNETIEVYVDESMYTDPTDSNGRRFYRILPQTEVFLEPLPPNPTT